MAGHISAQGTGERASRSKRWRVTYIVAQCWRAHLERRFRAHFLHGLLCCFRETAEDTREKSADRFPVRGFSHLMRTVFQTVRGALFRAASTADAASFLPPQRIMCDKTNKDEVHMTTVSVDTPQCPLQPAPLLSSSFIIQLFFLFSPFFLSFWLSIWFKHFPRLSCCLSLGFLTLSRHWNVKLSTHLGCTHFWSLLTLFSDSLFENCCWWFRIMKFNIFKIAVYELSKMF